MSSSSRQHPEPRVALWRRLDEPGHEAVRVSRHGDGWLLEGSAVFAAEGEPCLIAYTIVCDGRWWTQRASVGGWIGRRDVDLKIEVDQQRRWAIHGVAQPGVAGCVDLDLNFSPATNLLPIRRLALPVGEQAVVRAAWLRFPSLALEPLEQIYRRTAPLGYRYESADGAFMRELEVDETGLVTAYPGLWALEAG